MKDYQALVIDEAHKLPETVRQMNTRRICSAELLAYEKMLTAGHCGLSAQKLRAVTREFLAAFAPPETKAERAIPLKQTKVGTAALQHLDKAIGEILKQRPEAMPRGLRGKLSAVQQLIPLFLGTDSTFVRYLTWHRETGGIGVELCAVPFDLPKCLSSALWDEQKPAILTSGTLAAGEDFSYAEKRMGLDRGTPLRTLKVLSPFDYKKNCMLYFPESRRCKSEPEEERIARKEGTGVQEYIQQMPDGRTRIQREVEGGSVTIYFSEKDDEDTLEKVKSMIMDAYAERKHREGKPSNSGPQ